MGVSVCYSSAGEEDELECFVGGVAEGSVAARDGRIRRGDQVLQLNGETLTGQVQAQRLFAEADLATTVTLLLSRLPPQVRTPFMSEKFAARKISSKRALDCT